MKKILITGANGQIGSELSIALRKKYGVKNVITSDIRENPDTEAGPFEFIDVTKPEDIKRVVEKYNIDTIFHMAAILSAVGEQNPQLCWTINIGGLYNVLEVAKSNKVKQVYCPSSIAAFGPSTPKDNTSQETILEPNTMYGVTKVTGELLCNYYVERYGMDIRGIRYPGIISHKVLPGGGTTDYAVAIYYDAITKGSYECFVSAETVLPMMYMPDCIKATIDLMETDFSKLKHHSNFNLSAMSFSAAEQAESIRKYIPDFKITYKPDYRQNIANSWPRSIDDSASRQEWDWKPDYDLDAMTRDMLKEIRIKKERGEI